MKSVVTSAIATLMLLGILSAAAMPKHAQNNAVLVANGAPMPTCDPGGGCPPPIPPR